MVHLKKTDNIVKWFWEVVAELSNEDRRTLVEFAWGRQSLPSPDSGEKWEFKLTKYGKSALQHSQGAGLKAHTCFNQIEIPYYKTKGKVREKVMEAIAVCRYNKGVLYED